MRNRLLVLCLLFFSIFQLHAIPATNRAALDEGPWVVRVYQLNASDFTHLRERFDLWKADSDDRFAVLFIKNPTEMRLLEQLGFPVYVDPKATAEHRNLSKLDQIRGSGIPNFSCYRTVEETLSTAQQIVSNNPTIAEIIDIGDSWEKTQNSASGFDLRVLKLTNQNIAGDKPKLHVMSAIHARELSTAETVTQFAERLAAGYNNNPDITWLIDHHEIHLLLQANPDGRKQAEGGDLWRKNTNADYCTGTPGSRGSDLNRNFPFQWGGQGASTDECNDTFRGASAASEPEASSVVDYLRSIFPDQRGDQLTDPAPLDATGIHIAVHSFSQLVLWPYGFSTSSVAAPNAPQLSTLGRKFAFYNNYRPQRSLSLGAAAGATDDFAYGDLGIASYTFELGTAFFQDCNFFQNSILNQNIDALMYAAKVARTPYQTPSGPDVNQILISPNTLLPGDNANISLESDGTRFSTLPDPTSPLETPRVISGIDVFFNTLPWASQPTTTATADDGSFDETQESASATVSTTGLAEGRYTVFTQAIGQDNQAGAITAGFVFVLNPATAGRLFGRVVVDGTTTPVPNALITAGNFQTSSDAQGDYSLNLPPDTYSLEVSAEGFGSNTAMVTIDTSEQENLELSVLNRCELFADDIENGNIGWTPDVPWAITSEQSSSPTQSWHDSPGGSYQNNLNISLVSPQIDLSLATDTVLDFNHICDTESGFDFGIIETSTDGNNWNEVYRCDDQESFQNQNVNLSALDGSATARFRFRLVTDGVQNDNGWYIDDVSVTAASPACTPLNPDVVFSNGFE